MRLLKFYDNPTKNMLWSSKGPFKCHILIDVSKFLIQVPEEIFFLLGSLDYSESQLEFNQLNVFKKSL